MAKRISGKVYGDLTGSIFEPEVKSIVNVATGTLPIARGGTGLTSVGASGSALVSNGSEFIYATIVGLAGGLSAAQISGAINVLTSSISASYVQKSGDTFTGLIVSSGTNASYYQLADGTQLYSFAQYNTVSASNPSIGDLYVYTQTSSSWLPSKSLSGSYALSGTLQFVPQNTLPTGVAGQFAVSGTSLYFYNGNSWRAVTLI